MLNINHIMGKRPRKKRVKKPRLKKTIEINGQPQ
jgi:hypothetical protein